MNITVHDEKQWNAVSLMMDLSLVGLFQRLQYGTEIEVFFKLSNPKGDDFVWWPATVQKLSVFSDENGLKATGKLRYRGMRKFRSCVRQVVFSQNGHLKLTENEEEYWWRFLDGKKEDSAGNSAGDEDEDEEGVDQTYSPPGLKREEDGLGTVTVEEDGMPRSEEMQQKRELKFLRRKVDLLEAKLSSLSSVVSSLQVSGQPTEICQAKDSIALKYLSSRMREYFMRTLSMNMRAGTVEFRKGMGKVSQEYLRRGSDCSLLELDLVAEHIRKTAGDSVEYKPSFQEFCANPQQEMLFTFRTFEALAAVFGKMTESDLTSCLVKGKTDRGTGRITILRCLGSVVQNLERSEVPVIFSIGNCLADGGAIGSSHQLWVRKDSTWNHTDGMFSHPIVSETILEEDLPTRIDEVKLRTEDVTRLIQASLFTIRWKQDSDIGTRKLFDPRPSSSEVLGTLEVIIPYVVMRGRQADVFHGLLKN